MGPDGRSGKAANGDGVHIYNIDLSVRLSVCLSIYVYICKYIHICIVR